MKRKYFFPVFFLLLQNIPALDLRITGKETGADFRGEYNRALALNPQLSDAIRGMDRVRQAMTAVR